MIPAEVYTERRKKLMKLLGTGVIVIPPNPKMKYSQDKYFKYRPNSNIFYLSGMIQEDTIIVLDNISKKSYLFLLQCYQKILFKIKYAIKRNISKNH